MHVTPEDHRVKAARQPIHGRMLTARDTTRATVTIEMSRLHGHRHLRPPGQRHHVGRAERRGVGERQVQVVEEGGSQSGGTISGGLTICANWKSGYLLLRLSARATGPPRSNSQYHRPNTITLVSQMAPPVISSWPGVLPRVALGDVDRRAGPPTRRWPG